LNNFESVSKLDKINFNSNYFCNRNNIGKSYQNLNDINNLQENYGNDISCNNNSNINKKNALKSKNNNSKGNKHPANFNSYLNFKMLKPKKNINNPKNSSSIAKTFFSQGNQILKRSVDNDKSVLNFQQYSKCYQKLKDQSLSNNLIENKTVVYKDSCSQNKKNSRNDNSNINNYFNMKDRESSITEFITENNLKYNDYSSLNDNSNQKINFPKNNNFEIDKTCINNFIKLNDCALKFSRNEKNDRLGNLYLNTYNDQNNISKNYLTNQQSIYKNNFSSFNNNNLNYNNLQKNNNNPEISKNNNKNLNIKSIELSKSNIIGINSSISCMNKDHKRINFNALSNQELKESLMNNKDKHENLIKKNNNNLKSKNNNQSNTDFCNAFAINGNPEKIKEEYVKLLKSNVTINNNTRNIKTSHVIQANNENKKCKKLIFSQNKRQESNNTYSEMGNYVNQSNYLNNVNNYFAGEKSSNKKYSKDAKFIHDTINFDIKTKKN